MPKPQQNRTKAILQKLKKNYPDAHCALDHDSPEQLLIATILSAQCTDARVNIVTKSLFKKYPTMKAFAEAQLPDLENDIRSTGFYKNKAQNIKSCAQKIVREYGGRVPKTMNELTALAGVGRKTANVVLGNAFQIASGVVVDTHVSRLSQRMGMTKQKTPEKIEQDLMKIVPTKDWVQVSHWLIMHGRGVCKARNPACDTCFLDDICPKRI